MRAAQAKLTIRCPPRTPLVAEHCKGSERYGHLNHDHAEREQPDFSLGLRIHGSPNAQRHGSFQGGADLALIASERTIACIRENPPGGMPSFPDLFLLAMIGLTPHRHKPRSTSSRVRRPSPNPTPVAAFLLALTGQKGTAVAGRYDGLRWLEENA
jgi:hypothetical protein